MAEGRQAVPSISPDSKPCQGPSTQTAHGGFELVLLVGGGGGGGGGKGWANIVCIRLI